jgi:hypothetical protein
MVNLTNAKVYKRCDTQCYKCRQCREFAKVVEEIDLEQISRFERQQKVDKERSRDQ